MSNASHRFAALVGCIAAGTASVAPLAAGSGDSPAVAEQAQTAEPSSASAVSQQAELVEFNYKRFFRRAMQLGVLSQKLGYTVEVAADGSVSECSLARDFDNPYTSAQLCKAIVRYSRFEPARDEQGSAIVATYSGQVEIDSYFTPGLR